MWRWPRPRSSRRRRRSCGGLSQGSSTHYGGAVPDVSFHKLVPQDLKGLAAVAQTLDNQWVPRDMLDRMIAGGLSLADVRAEREQVVRTEYLRAVLNAEQLVI